MITYIEKQKKHLLYRIISGFVAVTFIVSTVVPPSNVFAQVAPTTVLNLPVPGTMISPSNGFMPTLIKSITVHPEDPFKFNFLVDTGDSDLNEQEVKKEAHKLIKYFYAALTTPEADMWVNLSPYEKDRIVAPNFGDTEMGRDLLAQDYILKQLTASLMYPEEETGKKFWDRVYQRTQELYGTAEIPTDTFHKVWIVPETAVIYEKDASAYVVESHLKVMMEDDYLALRNEKGVAADESLGEPNHTISTELIKEVLLPEIEKEVNEGENFSQLRQIYNSVILASWYKDNLKESLLGQVYVDQGKTKGVDVKDKQITQKIYNQYIEAFKQGVYDYIREDYDPTTQEFIPRKYFSGGTELTASQVREDYNGNDGASSPAEDRAAQAASRPNSPTSYVFDVASSAIEATDENELAAAASSPLSFQEAVDTKRTPVVGYNMKGENLTADIDAFLEGLAHDYQTDPIDPDSVGVIVIPAEGDLKQAVAKRNQLVADGLIPEGFIKIFAQNIRVQGLGAYTGHAPSIDQIFDWKVDGVLLGHSELSTNELGERTIVESNTIISEKYKILVENGIQTIMAYGDTIADAKKGSEAAKAAREKQLRIRTSRVSAQQIRENDTIFAYEPVSAIGVNAVTTVTPKEAEEIIEEGRQWLYDNKGPEVAAQIRIQFGGSVKGDSAIVLSSKPNVDGGLIGSAAKKWHTAAPIHKAFAVSVPLESTSGRKLTVRSNVKGQEDVAVTVRLRAQLVKSEKERVDRLFARRDINIAVIEPDAGGAVTHDIFTVRYIHDGVDYVGVRGDAFALLDDEQFVALIDDVAPESASSPVVEETGVVSSPVSAADEAKATLGKAKLIEAWNRDAQSAFSADLIEEGSQAQAAFVEAVMSGIGTSSRAARVFGTLEVSKTQDVPKVAFPQKNRDGITRWVIGGGKAHHDILEPATPDSLDRVKATDGLQDRAVRHTVTVFVPGHVDEATVEAKKKKIQRDMGKQYKLEMIPAGSSNKSRPTEGMLARVDEKTLDIKNVTGVDGKWTAIQAQLWYERKGVFKRYKSSIPDSVVEGLPISSASAQEMTGRTIPIFYNEKVIKFGMHAGAGKVTGAALKQHIQLVAAGRVDQSKVWLSLLTGATYDRIVDLLLHDTTHGPFLNVTNDDATTDKIVKDKDAEGREVVRIRYNGVWINPIVLLPYSDPSQIPYRELGVTAVIDGSGYISEEDLKAHLGKYRSGGVDTVINTSIGKPGPDGNLPIHQTMMGVNDHTKKYLDAYREGGLIDSLLNYATSCTSGCGSNAIDAIRWLGGQSGRYWRGLFTDLAVRQGLITAEEAREIELSVQNVTAYSVHGATQTVASRGKKGGKTYVLDGGRTGAGFHGNLKFSPSGANKGTAMLLEDVDPEIMSFVSARIPTDEGSILELIALISSLDGKVTREAILERLKYAEDHEKAHLLEVLDITNSLQVKGSAAVTQVLKRHLRVAELTDKTSVVISENGYANEWYYGTNILLQMYEILSHPRYVYADDVAGLHANITERFSGQVELLPNGEYRVVPGQENAITEEGGLVEYLAREAVINSTREAVGQPAVADDGTLLPPEVDINPNREVRDEAWRLLMQIVPGLGIIVGSKDELDRESLNPANRQDLEGSMVGANFSAGSLTGATGLTVEAIVQVAREKNMVPIIELDATVDGTSKRAGPLRPGVVDGSQRHTPQIEILDPGYLKKAVAMALGKFARAGYRGLVYFRNTIRVYPEEFRATSGTEGPDSVDVPVEIALQHARDQVRLSLEASVLNLGFDMTGLLNLEGTTQGLESIIKGELDALRKYYRDVFGSLSFDAWLTHLYMAHKYGKSYLKTIENEISPGVAQSIGTAVVLESQRLVSIESLYQAAYARAYEVARDLTTYTRDLEREMGLEYESASLEFEFLSDEASNVLGALAFRSQILQEGTLDSNLNDLVKPNRVIVRTSDSQDTTVGEALTTATQYLYAQHTQRENPWDVDFTALAAQRVNDPDAVRNVVIGAIMDKFLAEPNNNRVRLLVSRWINLWQALTTATEITGADREKLREINLIKSRMAARFRAPRAVFSQIFNELNDKGKSLEEIIAAILTGNGLPSSIDAKTRQKIQQVNDAIFRAYSKELNDLHPDEGRDEVAARLLRFYRDQAHGKANRIAAEDVLKTNRTTTVEADGRRDARLARAGKKSGPNPDGAVAFLTEAPQPQNPLDRMLDSTFAIDRDALQRLSSSPVAASSPIRGDRIRGDRRERELPIFKFKSREEKIAAARAHVLEKFSRETAAVQENLTALYAQGNIGGTGRLLISPIDQGLEHSALRSWLVNAVMSNKWLQVMFAYKMGMSGFVAPVGTIMELAPRWAKHIPLIAKVNSGNNVGKNDRPFIHSAMAGDIEELARRGVRGIGFTIYPGSGTYEEQWEEFRAVAAEARKHGMFVILWDYSRGQIPSDHEKALDVLVKTAQKAFEWGAHIVKAKPATAVFRNPERQKELDRLGIPYKTLLDRERFLTQIANPADGEFIHSGQAKTDDEEGLLRSKAEILLGGGSGFIVGRNLFQRVWGPSSALAYKIEAMELAAADRQWDNVDDFLDYAFNVVLPQLYRHAPIPEEVPAYGPDVNPDGSRDTTTYLSKAVRAVAQTFAGEKGKLRRNLERIYSHGRLAGTGKLAIVPYSMRQNIRGKKRNNDNKVSAYTVPAEYAAYMDKAEVKKAPPLIATVEPVVDLENVPPAVPDGSKYGPHPYENGRRPSNYANPPVLNEIKGLAKKGFSAIEYTLRPGSRWWMHEMTELRSIIAEARKHGLPVFVRALAVSNGGFLKDGQEKATDVVVQAAHLALEAGAHHVTVDVPDVGVFQNTTPDKNGDQWLLDRYGYDYSTIEAVWRILKQFAAFDFTRHISVNVNNEAGLDDIAASLAGGSDGVTIDAEADLTDDELAKLLDFTKVSSRSNFKTGAQLAEAAASPVSENVVASSPVKETVAANTSSSPVGGINLNDAFLNKRVIRDGNGIPLPAFQQPILQMEFDGLLPIITNVTIVPVSQLPLILGLVDQDQGEPFAGSDSDNSLDSVRNEYFDKMAEDEELVAG